ncbi:MAG: VCBS repeat-containing protein [Flavobacteriaceae bacterium]|nr:VCBS repeat-containing protein [Flavobacteriaceae bacterium]
MKNLYLFLFLFAIGFSIKSQVTFTPATPFATSYTNRAVVDMNGDFLDDVVSVNSTHIQIFYQQPGGTFNEVNITTTPADNTPSWSLAAGDYDDNGYTDLLYGGGNGVTFMRANNDGTAFTEISYPEYVFSQRSNFVDINNDGHLDAFVCHDVAPNVYFLNDGDGNLTFHQGGIGDYPTGGHYGSVWIDYDNDGDMDMFNAKCNVGGQLNDRSADRLHNNDGTGVFTEVALEAGLYDEMQTWSSAWADYDNDGYMDVFVGSSSSGAPHKLKRNNGDGTFTDISAGTGINALTAVGIENCTYDFNNDGYPDILSNGNLLLNNGDLTFTLYSNVLPSDNGSLGDLNNDGFIDAIAVGDWMAVSVFLNDEKKLTLQKNNGLDTTHGFWNTIKAADFDRDGDTDFIIGNWGLNSRLNASEKEPITLYKTDFDGNGSEETLVTYFYQGIETPIASKEELAKQMPFINKNYLSYRNFAEATIKEVFSEEKLSKSLQKRAFELASCYFENTGSNTFKKHILPFGAQVSSVNDIWVEDFNNDGNLDLLLVGNNFEISTQLGRLDASRGALLLNDGKGNFAEKREETFNLSGACRAIQKLTVAGKSYWMITRNNNTPLFLKKTNE